MGEERRRYERFTVEEEIFCYIGGERVEASSRDISVGGVFIRTPYAQKVAPGTVVGLVFQSYRGQERPVYLFGRVVRQQGAPDPGLGIQWEHAVTLGTPARLAAFLGETLKIQNLSVRIEPMGEGRFRSIYVFPGAPKSPPPLPDDIRQADPLLSTLRQGPPPGPPGALSQMIRRSDVAPATALPAEVVTGARTIKDATITRVDAIGLYIQAPQPLGDPVGATVTVRFGIRTHEGLAPVVAQCVVAQQDAAGEARLLIKKLDEGRHPGIFARYVRWLSFRALSARPQT